MTDYESEQAMEMEALEAILMDDLQPYEGTLPDGWKAAGQTYKVSINPDEDGESAASSSHQKQLIELLFAHTATYPDEAPCFKLRAVQGLSDADVAKGTTVLQEVVAANLGMAMIYALVAAAKEWLQNRAGLDASGEPHVDPALARKKELDEDEKRRAEARAHSVMVTVETFTAWKTAYDAELAAERQRLLETGKIDEKSQRLTGKAYFLAQMSAVDEEEEDMPGSSDEDDAEFHDPMGPADGAPHAEGDDDEEEEGEEDDLDYDDDDDEGLLDEYVPVPVTVPAPKK